MAQVYRFSGTDAHGEYVPGRPRGPLTDDWLEATATAEGVTVKELRAEIESYKRVDGKPLYVASHSKAEEHDEASPKPKVPLGEKPPQP